ncbi:hypothetical protein Hanom_Chr08g00736871 [Helianthus anomalus]
MAPYGRRRFGSCLCHIRLLGARGSFVPLPFETCGSWRFGSWLCHVRLLSPPWRRRRFGSWLEFSVWSTTTFRPLKGEALFLVD